LVPISTVVFSAFITASAIGSSELKHATPIGQAERFAQRSAIMPIVSSLLWSQVTAVAQS
jgi:hypothetical protein